MTPDAWPDFCQGSERTPADSPDSVPVPPAASQEESFSGSIEQDLRPDNAVPPIPVPQPMPTTPQALLQSTLPGGSIQNFLVAPAMADEELSPDVRALLRPSESPWCSPFLSSRMDELVSSMKHRTLEREEKTVMLRTALTSREQFFRRLSDSVARTHQRQLRLACVRFGGLVLHFFRSNKVIHRKSSIKSVTAFSHSGRPL